MAPQLRDDLPQVAQYLSVNLSRQFPRDELSRYLREELLLAPALSAPAAARAFLQDSRPSRVKRDALIMEERDNGPLVIVDVMVPEDELVRRLAGRSGLLPGPLRRPVPEI